MHEGGLLAAGKGITKRRVKALRHLAIGRKLHDWDFMKGFYEGVSMITLDLGALAC